MDLHLKPHSCISAKRSSDIIQWMIGITLVIYGIRTALRYYVELLFGYDSRIDMFVFALIAVLYLLAWIGAFIYSSGIKDSRVEAIVYKAVLPIFTFFLVSFVVSLIVFGIRYRLIFLVTQFIFFGTPALFAGAYAALEEDVFRIISKIERLSVIILPVSVIYVVLGALGVKPVSTVGGLGNLNYMQISYMILPFLFAEILLVIQKKTDVKRKENRLLLLFLRILIIVLYLLALLIASTRNTIFCVILFILLLIPFGFYFRKYFSIGRLIIIVIIVLGLGTSIIMQADRSSAFWRTVRFKKSIEQIISGEMASDILEKNDELTQTPPDISELSVDDQDIDKPVAQSTTSDKPSAQSTSSDEPSAQSTTSDEPSAQSTTSDEPSAQSTTSDKPSAQSSMSEKPSTEESTSETLSDVFRPHKETDVSIKYTRIELFSIALRESTSKPLFGLFPIGFYYKYPGYYPHNIFLELVAEWGIIIGGATSLTIIFLFLKSICRDNSVMTLLVFLAGYAPQLMLSGSVWDSHTLFFGLTFALGRIILGKRLILMKSRKSK